MTPDEDKDAFEDISKHKFFNTNNLWVNLEKLKVSPICRSCCSSPAPSECSALVVESIRQDCQCRISKGSAHAATTQSFSCL